MNLSFSHSSVIRFVVYDISLRNRASLPRSRSNARNLAAMTICAVGSDDPKDSVAVRYRCARGDVVDSTLDRVSVAEVADGRPVREFRSYKGRRHYSGWYWSATVAQLIAYESRLELARIMLADFDPGVVAIASQPFQLSGTDGTKKRRHVPDVLTVGTDRSVTVIDVKPASRLGDPVVAAVFAWTGELVARRGWRFEVWSGADSVLLANVRFLAGYRRALVVEQSLVGPVISAVSAPGATVASVERSLLSLAPTQLVRPVVLHLLWTGTLTADLTRPLGADSPLSLGAVA